MVSDLVIEEGILNTLSFDYKIERILECLDNSEDLIINNCSEEYLLNIFKSILYNRLFNEKQVLILYDDYFDKIINTEAIKNLDKRIIKLNNSIDFESNLKEQFLSLPETTGKTIISKVEVLSRSINKKNKQLLDIIKFFTSEREKSLSLIRKYEITHKKLSKYDPLYKYYSIYRMKNPLEKYSYFEIENCVNKIIDSDIIKKYIKYRRFIDNNKFKIFKEPINYEILNLAILNIAELIKGTNFKVQLNYSKYTEDFIETFSVNPNMQGEDLKNLVNIVNFKYNYNLLSHRNKNKLLNIFTKRKATKEYENNLNKYYIIEDDITKEYKDNLDKLNSYICKLEFLKDILNEQEYSSLLNDLIKGEDLIDNLLLYKKIFNISYDIKDLLISVNSLTEIESELLNYAYNNVEDKKFIEDVIINIPKLKLYLEIEEEEFKASTYLEKYKEFDKLLNDLNKDIIIRNSLIPETINYIWNNKLREQLHMAKNNIEKFDFSNKEIIKSLFPCIIANIANLELNAIREINIKFDKIIYIGKEDNINYQSLQNIKKISDNVIILCKDRIDNFINLQNYKNLDFPSIDNLITCNYPSKDIIINEIEKYIEGLGYISEKNVFIDEFNIKLLIKDKNLNTIAAIEIDAETINSNSSYKLKDIYLKNVLKEKSIKLYRVWSRDWWINKSKELSKLEEFLQIK